MILDATSIDPKKTWEPHRDSLEEIAARVEADEHDGDSESTVFRASVDARFEEMEKTLQTLKEAFKETTEHLRCFAEDLKHGKATFAATYAATYDRVQAETTAAEGAGEAGAASERDSTPSVYAGEKTDFHVESPAAVADKTVFHVAPSEEKTTFGATTRERKTRDDNSVEVSARRWTKSTSRSRSAAVTRDLAHAAVQCVQEHGEARRQRPCARRRGRFAFRRASNTRASSSRAATYKGSRCNAAASTMTSGMLLRQLQRPHPEDARPRNA